jgi:hypothetical protein
VLELPGGGFEFQIASELADGGMISVFVRAVTKHCQQVLFQSVVRIAADVTRKLCLRESATADTEHCRQRQICREDRTFAVERDVSDGGEFVEIRVTIVSTGEFGLGIAQLLVLKFQLDLVNLQFTEEAVNIVSRHPGNVGSRNTQPLFGLLAEFVGRCHGLSVLPVSVCR